jgi:HPt (histidine-containing phosphotransfer) domain-containing protein
MPIQNPDYREIDHEEIAKAIGLKVKHVPMLIGSFLEESSPIIDTMYNYLQANDYESLRSAAHSVKGSAGNLRFAEVSQMAKELEHAASNQDATFEYSAYIDAMKKALSTISL